MSDKTKELETPAEFATWAKDVAKSVRLAELARLVKDYRQQARNKRRGAADRDFARKRGNVLAKLQKRNR